MSISARAPKQLFWLDIVTVGELKYREKGGGKYTNARAAITQQQRLAARGIKTKLYQSEPIKWKRVKP